MRLLTQPRQVRHRDRVPQMSTLVPRPYSCGALFWVPGKQVEELSDFAKVSSKTQCKLNMPIILVGSPKPYPNDYRDFGSKADTLGRPHQSGWTQSWLESLTKKLLQSVPC